eukprot:4365472-Alexandrium_andersonii.AAC.1
MGRNTHRVTEPPSQSQIFCPHWEVAVPAPPQGQTALSAARNLQKARSPDVRRREPEAPRSAI